MTAVKNLYWWIYRTWRDFWKPNITLDLIVENVAFLEKRITQAGDPSYFLGTQNTKGINACGLT